jgi:hypothetical protein
VDQFDPHHFVHPGSHEQQEQSPAGNPKEDVFECFGLFNGLVIVVNELDILGMDGKI